MKPEEVVSVLAAFSTPTILNGLKRLGVHPSEMKTFDRSIRCMSPALGPCVGYAVTRKVSTSREPLGGPSIGLRQQLESMLQAPSPRVLVAENIGDYAGPVCIWGDLAANMNLAMACSGGITNGPVRDLPEMEAVGFRTFAGGIGVGGGFVQTLAVGDEVSVGGVQVQTGDLIHGDIHGAVVVPLGLAELLPDAIKAHDAEERRIIELCRSPDFSPEALERLFALRHAK